MSLIPSLSGSAINVCEQQLGDKSTFECKSHVIFSMVIALDLVYTKVM